MSFRSIKWVILKAFGLYTIAVRVVQHAVLLPFRLGIFLILSAFRLVTNILLGACLSLPPFL